LRGRRRARTEDQHDRQQQEGEYFHRGAFYALREIWQSCSLRKKLGNFFDYRLQKCRHPTQSQRVAILPFIMSDLLEEDDLQSALKKCPEWEYEKKAIIRVVEFEEFNDAIDFVNGVAEIVEEAQHHPEINIRHTRVLLKLTTHDAGGVTDADIELAQRIDNLID
jgi:4a-hydroxytetrahydrobiopterin dehydratase